MRIIGLGLILAALLATPATAQQVSCEDQRDMYRTLIDQLRGQRAVTEVDVAQELMTTRREVARLRAEVDKLKAKPAEAPKPKEGQP
jgi:hypothetical protein